jgi:NitT/TauT family transport system permease protein
VSDGAVPGPLEESLQRLEGGEEVAAYEGVMVPPEIGGIGPLGRTAGRLALRAVPPAIVFVLLVFLWEYAVRALHVPDYTLPAPSRIVQTIPTIDELKTDAFYTSVQEALPGYLIGSGLGFLVAVIASRFTFVARGVLPYAVISNSIPIIGMAPIAVVLFGFDWQSKAFVVAVLTFFPMVINAYRGLVSLDPLTLQLMQSYAASSRQMFVKLRLPASLPYVFNGLKINTTLAMIGAIVGEYFGAQAEGLGYYIKTQAGSLSMDQVWAAVVVACAIGIAAYVLVVIVERLLTSWHISYRAGR